MRAVILFILFIFLSFSFSTLPSIILVCQDNDGRRAIGIAEEELKIKIHTTRQEGVGKLKKRFNGAATVLILESLHTSKNQMKESLR